MDDQSCSPSFISSVSPGFVPADGQTNTFSVTGQALDRITQVYVNKLPITFTLVNSTLITFNQAYAATGSHEVSFRSNCLVEPLDVYTIETETSALRGVSAPTDCKLQPSGSRFSVTENGATLCWKGNPARLIGYSGDFDLVTRDDIITPPSTKYWNLTGGKDSSHLKDYFLRAQFNSLAGESDSRGTNFIRLLATGGSCNELIDISPQECVGYGSKDEIMPFNRLPNGKFSLDAFKSSGDGSKLSTKWKARLLNFLKYADQNGIAVMISLFDENTLTGGAPWGNNPWNPAWNDISCFVSDDPNHALPDFYVIDSTNNCLRDVQKNYVLSVVNTVKNSKVCKNGTQICKNVIFEVMNEARFTSGLTLANFQNWHTKVATWVRGKGYLVAASVKGVNGTNEFAQLDACSGTSCPNYFNVFHIKSDSKEVIDIVSLHFSVWDNDICARDDEALVFGKPVIFDDDGGPQVDKNNNCGVIRKSARNVLDPDGSGASCDHDKGKVHFYHTGDATGLQTEANPTVHYEPLACQVADDPSPANNNVDCLAWNALGDGLPTKFCGGAGATACSQRQEYCEIEQDPPNLNMCPLVCP